jgi:hypothetical protein
MIFTFRWTKEREEIKLGQGLINSNEMDDAARAIGGDFADRSEAVD